MFEIVNGRRTDDGRMPKHGYTISSPCEPEGSGELIIHKIQKHFRHVLYSIGSMLLHSKLSLVITILTNFTGALVS